MDLDLRDVVAACRPGRPSATTDPRSRARAVYGLAQVRGGIHGPCVLERKAGCVCHHYGHIYCGTLHYTAMVEISHRHRLAADRPPPPPWIVWGKEGRQEQAKHRISYYVVQGD